MPTLPNGTVVPQDDGDVQISATGVAEMRALGASVDAQLGDRYTKAQADALLAGKSPATHTHDDRYYTETETDSKLAALQAQLEALSFDTGWRLLPNNPAEVTSGRILLRRVGRQVWLWMDEVLPVDSPTATSVLFSGLAPLGFRPPGTVYLPTAQRSASYSPGPFRVQPTGSVDCYNNNGNRIVALMSWLSSDPAPAPADFPGSAVAA